MELRIKRFDKEVKLPFFAHPTDAAMDMHSAEDRIVQPNEKVIISSGIGLEIPIGHVGLVWDRSGMAAKKSMHTLSGVIDAGYRGDIGIVMINLGTEAVEIKKNMRIAQLLIQKIYHPKIIEVEDLSETDRGEGRFGSTGE